MASTEQEKLDSFTLGRMLALARLASRGLIPPEQVTKQLISIYESYLRRGGPDPLNPPKEAA